MQKALLIAEKPSLMRDIKKAYEQNRDTINYDITFVAQAGHLVELLDPIEINPQYKSWDVSLLPIDPAKEGGWQYKVTRSCRDLYKNIETEIKSGKYDVIIHAGDPDQEGELLVRLVLQKIGNTLPVLRLWTNANTSDEYARGLRNLEPDSNPQYENFYHAALLRQHTDWLFGMNGSRGLADRIATGPDNKIAVGRVMTWVLAAIVNREDEINNFVPKTSYGVKVTYANDLSGDLIELTDKEKLEGKVVYFDSKSEADDVLNNLAGQGTVVKYQCEREKTFAPKLYEMGSLQQDAGLLGFTAKETLDTAQSLYEKKYLTYPRTDCETLPSDTNLRGIISSAASVDGFADAANYALQEITRIRGNKKFINDADVSKHGHTALTPTTVSPDFSTLSEKEKIIYTMVAKRFLAIFQPPLIQDKIVVITKNKDYYFKSTGKTIIDPGYTVFLETNVQNINIPPVKEGDMLVVSNKELIESTTVCPKRFKDGTLIQAMKNPAKYLEDKTIKDDVQNFKIGTNATRDSIIEKLIKDKYITRDKKGYLIPQDFGIFMIHTINGASICKTDTSGRWEQILSKVRFGEMSYEEADKYMNDQMLNLLSEFKNINRVSYGNASRVGTLMVCPGCGKNIIAGPKNYFCEGYKDGCKYSLPKKFLEAEINEDDAKTLFEGGIIEKTLTKQDKSAKWKQKLGFDSEAGKFKFIEAEDELTSFHCPCCQESLYRRNTKLNCKGCGFFMWTTPFYKQLSDKEIKQLLEQRMTEQPVTGLKKRDGGTFSTRLKLKIMDNEGKVGF